jgi:hypothetical protein
MCTGRNLALVVAPLVAALVGVACDRAAAPVSPQVGMPQLHVFPGEAPACFRLTGGGRIDKPELLILMPQPKNTPESRDFATFGFQARPNACDSPEGSGQIEWVDHNPAAPGGGFSFHGVIHTFGAVSDHYETTDDRNGCGAFSGTGRFHTRSGDTGESDFIVEHACDRGEPGVGRDHIRICIGHSDPTRCRTDVPPSLYRRDGVLTGGNIQKHKLGGSGT